MDRYRDSATLNALCGKIADVLEELLEDLEVDLEASEKKFVGPCPIHGGDKTSSFNLFRDGDDVRGNWLCYTHHCENYFHKSIIGFTRGVLSHKEHDWQDENGRTVSHRYAVDYLLRFAGLNLSDLEHGQDAQMSVERFIKDVNCITKKPVKVQYGLCSRKQFRTYVDIPAEYYVGRGYSTSVLDAYDVGYCDNPASGLYGRVVVPIYDDDYKTVLGCTGRSPHEQCGKCKLFHGDCPCPKAHARVYSKWMCMKGFNDKNYLYNYWKARDLILQSRCVVVVEGAGDVWRLEEAGIHNSVGLFGSGLSDPQRLLFQACGPRHFIVVTDKDKAGDEAAKGIEKDFGPIANICRLELPTKDVGDMSVADVERLIKPVVMSRMKG